MKLMFVIAAASLAAFLATNVGSHADFMDNFREMARQCYRNGYFNGLMIQMHDGQGVAYTKQGLASISTSQHNCFVRSGDLRVH